MKNKSEFHAWLARVSLIFWVVSAAAVPTLYGYKPESMMIAIPFNLFALGTFVMNATLSHAYLIAAKFLGED